MMLIILQALYFMLPAYIANMMPVFVQKIPWGNFPLDHKKMWRGKRILGDHKTYRGLVSGVLAGTAISVLQKTFHSAVPTLALIPYYEISYSKIILIGFFLSFGILLGDMIKSFFKRQKGITDGGPWIPFDQLDFLGALVLISLFFTLPIRHFLIILFVTPILVFLTDVLGYFTGLRKVWW